MKQYKKTYIMMHHSATPDGKTFEWEAIRRYHKSKGWRDIGYHWGIEKIGNIYKILKGREEWDTGAHCKEGGMNKKAIGICLVGNYDNEPPTEEQYKLLARLCREIMNRHNIPIDNIVMHRQYAINRWTGNPYKSCPGWKFDLEKLKKYILAWEVINVFKDIQGHWAQASIERLEKLGLIKGDGEGNFNPDKPITRAEVAVLLDRLLKLLGR